MKRRIVLGLAFACHAALLGTLSLVPHVAASDLSEAALPSTFSGHRDGALFDAYGRLTAYPNKIEVPCPTQTARTAVVLVAGQSNAANYGNTAARSAHGGAVVNFFGGRCFIAQSPLLGASGEWGDAWTSLGNKLVESGAFDAVVIVPAAIGGTAAQQWTQEGRYHAVLDDTVAEAQRSYRFTQVIWFQGETDYYAHTPPQAYRAQLLDIIGGLRNRGVTAPVYMTVATRCEAIAPDWRASNEIAVVQKALGSSGPAMRLGVDADRLLASREDRHDNCHLSRSGVEKLSAAWLNVLQERQAARD